MLIMPRIRALRCIHLFISLLLVLLSAEMNYSFQRNNIIIWSNNNLSKNSNQHKSWLNQLHVSKQRFHHQAQEFRIKLTRKVKMELINLFC